MISDFSAKIKTSGIELSRKTVETLQLNLTKMCNQACTHCHVDSSPRRRESMSRELLERALSLLEKDAKAKTVDLTGGAPELHKDFKWFVGEVTRLNRKVIVRHNLTVTWDRHPLTGESMEYLPEFFREHRVEVVSSLPYYQEYFTDRQRGEGVFQKSIKSLQVLNRLGYGMNGTGLTLDLVYNPVGPFLPASQKNLEADYKRELKQKFEIEFSNLFVITNMPINRFAYQLKKLGSYEDYMEKLHGAFNRIAAESVMCRSMISVGHDGKVFDCDFNQMLGMDFKDEEKALTLFDIDFESFAKQEIQLANHCYGCTAGEGSSCGGSLI
jgi:radical SAM/Cys-rich protein